MIDAGAADGENANDVIKILAPLPAQLLDDNVLNRRNPHVALQFLKYLAPHVFRVAISDNRILECTDESVTFKYTPSKSKTAKTRTVAGPKFVRGFLQHVLPKGFQKVRYYGWMASNSQTATAESSWGDCWPIMRRCISTADEHDDCARKRN